MKTEEIFSFENLLAAHKLCRRSKQHKRGAIMFEIELARNLVRLTEELSKRPTSRESTKCLRFMTPNNG